MSYKLAKTKIILKKCKIKIEQTDELRQYLQDPRIEEHSHKQPIKTNYKSKTKFG